MFSVANQTLCVRFWSLDQAKVCRLIYLPKNESVAKIVDHTYDLQSWRLTHFNYDQFNCIRT